MKKIFYSASGGGDGGGDGDDETGKPALKGRKSYECQRCEFTTPIKTLYDRHCATNEHITNCGGDPATVAKFPCEICGKSYSSSSNLNSHQRKTHGAPLKGRYGCTKMTFRFLLKLSDFFF